MKGILKSIFAHLWRVVKKTAKGTGRVCKKLFHWFRHNFGMKITAIIFAFVLWSYVLVTTNPPRDKTLSALPVTVANEQLLHDRGLALVQDIASNVTARVVVQANNDRLHYIDADNVTVTAELSSISKEGTYRLELSAATQYGTVRRISPAYIDVTAEQYVSRLVTIDANTPKAPNGTWQDAVHLYPATVTISGAKSVVDSVAAASVTLSDEQMAQNVAVTLPIVLTDANGAAISKNIEMDAGMSVLTTHYYDTRRVPVQVQSSISAASGYVIESVEAINESVLIAGAEEKLLTIESLSTELLERTDLKESETAEVMVLPVDGVENIRPARVKVRITVREEEVTATYGSLAVTPRLGSDTNAPVAPNVTIAPVSITVTGYRSDIAKLNASSDIALYADVTDARHGQRAPLSWRWCGKDAMPQNLEVTIASDVVVLGN